MTIAVLATLQHRNHAEEARASAAGPHEALT
jgi:hypothetical protein